MNEFSSYCPIFNVLKAFLMHLSRLPTNLIIAVVSIEMLENSRRAKIKFTRRRVYFRQHEMCMCLKRKFYCVKGKLMDSTLEKSSQC